MIVELKDVMKKKLAEGVLISHRERQKSSRLALNARVLDSQLPNFQVEKGDSMSVRVPTVFQDAKAALINLGYREQEIQFLLERVSEGTDSTFVRAEDLIRAALRQLL
jgi:Holliday junction resolvasome RuvABC DNA-binding subunit